MNYRTAMNDLSIKGYLYARQLLPFLMIGLALLCLMPDSCFAAENRLSGLKEEVKATFGADSDLPYFLLLAEGLAGAYAYIKTKNIAVLCGCSGIDGVHSLGIEIMARNYQTFMLSDEPKIAGIPVTTGLPIFLLTGIGLLTGLAYQLFMIGAALSVAMHIKYGGLPLRSLFAIVYWSLPHRLTSLLFRALPDSANRIYIR